MIKNKNLKFLKKYILPPNAWIFINTFILIDYVHPPNLSQQATSISIYTRNTSFILINYKKPKVTLPTNIEKVLYILSQYTHLTKNIKYIEFYIFKFYKNLSVHFIESIFILCKSILLLFDDIAIYKKDNLVDIILKSFYKNSRSLILYFIKYNFIIIAINELYILYIYKIILYLTNNIFPSPCLKPNYLSLYFLKTIPNTTIQYHGYINQFLTINFIEPKLFKKTKSSINPLDTFMVLYEIDEAYSQYIFYLVMEIYLYITTNNYIQKKINIYIKVYSTKKNKELYFLLWNGILPYDKNNFLNILKNNNKKLDDWVMSQTGKTLSVAYLITIISKKNINNNKFSTTNPNFPTFRYIKNIYVIDNNLLELDENDLIGIDDGFEIYI